MEDCRHAEAEARSLGWHPVHLAAAAAKLPAAQPQAAHLALPLPLLLSLLRAAAAAARQVDGIERVCHCYDFSSGALEGARDGRQLSGMPRRHVSLQLDSLVLALLSQPLCLIFQRLLLLQAAGQAGARAAEGGQRAGRRAAVSGASGRRLEPACEGNK